MGGYSTHLQDIIYRLELQLLDPSVRVSGERLAELLADDFVEFGSSGRVYCKADVIAQTSQEVPATFAVAEFQVTELALGIALATYRLARRVVGSEQVNHSLRSSIWRRDESGWRIAFHQGTRIPAR